MVVFLYFIWAHLVHPNNDLLRGNFPDPDNYMYLTQIMDWLQGQNWYDTVQHRMNPPDGVAIPYSRLGQLPAAASLWFFEMLGFPARGAATLTAWITPPLFLLTALAAATLVACGGGDALNSKPTYLGTISEKAYDGSADDLLTAGLGASGLQAAAAPAYADPLKPTVAELRRNAIHTNYRAIVDTTTAGGYNVLYGPSLDASGKATLGEPCALPALRRSRRNKSRMAELMPLSMTMNAQLLCPVPAISCTKTIAATPWKVWFAKCRMATIS
jgi:hypothetical protein